MLLNTRFARFDYFEKVVKSIVIALFSLVASAGFAQSGTIILNGSTTLPVSSNTKFPIWLPGGSGQSINIGTNVSSISGILYNITPSTAGGNIMTVNSVVYITGSTPIASGTALKVEGILFASTSGSAATAWNLGGNTAPSSTILGTTDGTSAVNLEAGTGGLTIGTDAPAKTIGIGTASDVINVNANNINQTITGNFTLNGAAASNYSIGVSTTTGSISIGGAGSTTAIGGNETVAGTLSVTGVSTLTALTQTGTANINASGSAVTNIGTGSNTGAISIGNSSNSVALPAFTTAGVIHNAVATGRLSSSLVSLTTDVSGILPVANGGTGSTSQNFVDLTTTQTAGGAKTWSNNATFNGSVTMANLTTYVKSYNNSTASAITYSIARDWFDEVNWGYAGVLVEEFSFYPAYGNIDYGMYNAIYSYGGAGVTTKISSTTPVPAWLAHVSVGGTIYYRDLQITVPAYNYVTVRMTAAMPVTTNFSNTTQNYVYFY
jgi:hypothetical protein